MKKINVTKTFLPPLEEYDIYLRRIWESGQLTNQGPILQEFEHELSEYLKVENLHFVGNGTVALQIALRALDLEQGEIITTPFSYVATASAILWERYTPVFVDIETDSLCIDPSKIEAAITNNTKAIMPVHVFGNPCDVERIEAIARQYNLKVVYDAAHAFGVEYGGKSLLDYGDVSTCSFHATKLFHTIEGGIVVAQDEDVSKKVELIKRFGHQGDNHFMLGINGKASELQAAMGLCNLKYTSIIHEKRKRVAELYDELLGAQYSSIKRPQRRAGASSNYAYYPVIIESEEKLSAMIKALGDQGIYPRRYFYPSLNELPYVGRKQECPISEDIARRIMCLPLYDSLEKDDVIRICEIVINEI